MNQRGDIAHFTTNVKREFDIVVTRPLRGLHRATCGEPGGSFCARRFALQNGHPGSWSPP